MKSDTLSHVDEKNLPTMVDISSKSSTFRQAKSRAIIKLPPEIIPHINNNEITTKKGPVFQTAIIAGTMAVKKTADVIPFCHPIPLEKCSFDIQFIAEKSHLEVNLTVGCHYKTGIEMEALHGVSICCLTIYDMLKAISHDIEITELKVVAKQGGKHDF